MKAKPTAIDRLIGWISPKAGFKRLQFRQAMNLFEGADRGRRTKHWRTPDTSIQADTRRGLHLLRARARDLGQNNAYAASAHREIPANIVGTGIRPQVKLSDEARRRELEEYVQDWFGTTACDAIGEMTFYGIQNLVAKSVVEAGEALVVRRRRMTGQRRVPLQIEVLEPDYLDTSKDGLVAGRNTIIQGVEYSPRGQRVAYWLFDHHPGDQFYGTATLRSRRVAAQDVLHIRRIDRPGQVRGVPWAAPVLIRMRDYDEYEDAQLNRQKVAACFSVFVTPGEQWGPPKTSDDEAEDLPLPERVEPGMIEWLGDGKEVSFASPPGVSGYGEYASYTLHEIAVGYGAPYSVLTGDLRAVNFSSGRLGLLTFNRNVSHWQHNMMIPQLCQPVWGWFMEALQTMGVVDEPIAGRWSPPRRELTDPAREIPAIRDQVRSGLLTHAEAIRQQGYDPDDFIDEVRNFNEQMDEAGVVFDSDPRKVSAAGLSQPQPPEPAPTNPGEDDAEEE